MPLVKARIFHATQLVLRRINMDLKPRGASGTHGELMAIQGVDLVIDAGASVGRYGDWIRQAGYSGPICSLEPMAAPFRQLQRRAARDPAWECRRIALGPESGTATINVAGNSESSSLLPMERRHEQAAPSTAYIGTEEVQVRTLDEIWDEVVGEAAQPFLKLDVQGYELEVLRGAKRALGALHGVQVELSLVPLYAGGPLWDEVLEFMRNHGFHPAGVEGGYSDPHTGEMLQMDVLFVRD